MARSCGGCAWLGKPYDMQLRLKSEVVVEALAEHEELEGLAVEPCLPSPERRAYRNRAKLAVGRRGRQVALGLFRRGSDWLVDTASCPIHRPVLARWIPDVARWLDVHRLARPDGPVKHVDLRETADGGLHVTLVASTAPPRGRIPVEDLSRRMKGSLVGMAVNVNPHASSYVMGERTVHVWGSETFLAPVPGAMVGDAGGLVVPRVGFFQVNASQVPRVARRIASHLVSAGPGPWADLYCGVGTWGLLAGARDQDPDRTLMGIEENARAIDAAHSNARRMGRDGFRYRTGKTEDVFPDWAAATPPVAAVLNPGRPGCRPALLDALVASRPRRMAYLSCNPVSLSRDLATLVRGGFTVQRILPVDMMPQTEQVEALALLGEPGGGERV